jgi:type III pantothenate kinase
VTLDLLGADGRHLGGYILPGLRLGLEAVNRLFTEELQSQVAWTLRLDGEIGMVDPPDEPGHDTGKALLNGWMQGLAGAVERLVAHHPLAGQDLVWWLTGGDAARLSTLLGHPVNVVPGLVFDGLWCHLRPGCGQGSAP